MKSDVIKFSTQLIKNLRGIGAGLVTCLIFLYVLAKAWAGDLYWADDATVGTAFGGTWSTNTFSQWSNSQTQTSFANTGWVDGSVAHFLGSGGGSVFLESNITAAGINFDPGANAFIIDTNGNTLTITGAGIVNTSGKTQTIINEIPAGGIGSTFFFGASSASGVTIINNGDSTQFHDLSNAGSATITNNGGTGAGSGGVTEFFGTSSAGNAAITNNGGTGAGSGGVTEFFNNSTAGSATIINNGGTGAGSGGSTLFFDSSDGGTARAVTNGNGSFDISGLTTTGMNIGSIEGTGNYFLGSKTLTVGGNNLSTTVSGVIQDGGQSGGTGGSLTKVGTGTLTLTGANTYSGGTNFNGGTLAINSDSNLGTGALSFNGGTLEALAAGGGIVSSKMIALNSGGGTFLADAGTVSTLSGAVTGPGGWTKTGPGTLTLSGANTYTGATTVNAGVLKAGLVSAFSGLSAFTVNTGAVLDLNGFSNAVGSLAGSGLVFNSGGSAALSNATLTVGANNTSTTFSGTLQDGARTLALTKVGTGTLILADKNTYTGATTVNAGSLIVDGSIASLQTLVNSGGLLGGHGSLGGSLANSGIVSPGDSPGTLTVNNNYTQNSGGTLRIEVVGLALNQHDLLAVNGHASLAGTLQLISLGGFTLHIGDQVTFLTAKGGVSGNFSAIQNQLITGTLVKAQVVELPDAVVLEGLQGSFVPTACNPNAVAVARTLDTAVSDPRASTLITFLDSQPLNKICGDLGLISPEEQGSIFNIGVSLANVQTSNLMRRMDDIQAGSTGFSAAGFTLNGITPNSNGGFAGVSGPEGKSGPSVMAPTPENRWGVWVTGVGEFTSIDTTENAAGYYLETGGFNLGVDYRVCSNFAIGFTTGYAHTDTSLDNGGDIDVDVGTFGFYATAFGNGFYLDTAVTGGPNGYDTHRTALLGSANGNTDGGEFNVLVAGGYDWKKGGLSIGPTANFQYTYVGFTAFTESGSLAPLQFPSQNAESERTAFGMKASYEWKVGSVVIVPEISLAWQHEYGDQSYAIVSSLASGAGTSFTVNTPQVGRDSLLIGAGAAVQLNERISIYAYYDGELGRTNYQSNNVSGGIRMTF
jgi:outer membrane autotransporter protein